METLIAHSSNSEPDEMLRAATVLMKRAYTAKADRLMDNIKQQRLENQNKDMEIRRLEDEVENYNKQLDSRNERIQDIQDGNANLEADIQSLRNQLAELEATKNRLHKFRAAIMDSLREEETISQHQTMASRADYRHEPRAGLNASTAGVARNSSRTDQYLNDISDQLASSTRRSPLRTGSRY